MQYEAKEQELLFQWAELQKAKYPSLRLMFHIPNGGSRNAIEAANLKKQGVKAGVPDICLPYPCGIYHGLFIELKVGKNKPTEKQNQWLAELADAGYKTAVCYGWKSAADTILEYLNQEQKSFSKQLYDIIKSGWRLEILSDTIYRQNLIFHFRNDGQWHYERTVDVSNFYKKDNDFPRLMESIISLFNEEANNERNNQRRLL